MDESSLQEYIYRHIPIVEANHFVVSEATTSIVRVSGRYAEHLNHRKSVFGGSIASAATLAAWSLVRMKTEALDPNAIIVVRRQSVDFRKPVVRDFAATTLPLGDAILSRFESLYRKFGRAKIHVEVIVTHADSDESLASLTGDFVVIRPDAHQPGA